MKQELKQFAAQTGFARVHVCRLPDYTPWRAVAGGSQHIALQRLTDDVQSVFPEPCLAVILAWPYQPYEDTGKDASVSAYYPASDEANRRAEEIEKWLQDKGYRAMCHPNIPYKPIAVQSGFARYGRNGVTAIEGLGSRYALQVVLTDAPLEEDPGAADPFALSDSCADCGRCVRACPVGALDGTGRVDIHKCIRARSDEYPLEEAYRPLIGRSLYGCDICQDVCPRNAGIGRTPVPEELQAAMNLAALLRGDVDGLVPYIGKNYARKARMQAKACVIAVNAGRKDLLDQIVELKQNPVDFVQVHAEWAEQQLKK